MTDFDSASIDQLIALKNTKPLMLNRMQRM